MSELFEGSFRIEYDWYERVYSSGESIFRRIYESPEFYVKDPGGEYRSLLGDEPLSLRKRVRKSDNLEVYNKISPQEINSRKYWHPDSEKTKYNLNPRIWFLDIETTAYNRIDLENTPEEVVLIQIYDNTLNKMIVLGLRDWIGQDNYKETLDSEGIDVKYVVCKNEIHLFKTFFGLIKKLKPLLVLAWNGEGFDYPYLYKRSKKLGFVDTDFSPFDSGKTEFQEVVTKGGMKAYRFRCTGIYYMDYLEVYKKYTYGIKPSYSLDYISLHELGKGKIAHDMYSTFDGMRTGESYIFPNKVPDDEYERKMYNLQKEYKKNKTPELKEKIHSLANDLFVYYGLIDTYRLKQLDDKLQLSKIILMISSKMGVTLQDTLGTVKPWASYIEKSAFLNKQILPKTDIDEDADTSIKGGFVADPEKGKHRWIVSLDINSAYPNLSMRGFNMSPETYVPPKDLPPDLMGLNLKYFSDEDEEKRFELYLNGDPEAGDIFGKYTNELKKYNYSAAVNGAIFKQDTKGIIPSLVQKIYTDRKVQKAKMFEFEQKAIDLKEAGKDNSHENYMAQQYNTSQMVSKVLINSLYGGLGNKYFKLFNIHIARAITSNTRFYIHLLRHRINEYLQGIVKTDTPYYKYSDTDSVYLSFGPIIEKLLSQKKISSDTQEITDWLDRFIKKKIDPLIEEANKEFSDILNAYDPDPIKTEREIIADVGVFLNKKKYYARVIDSEGVRYHIPKLKVMGIEIARSSTPEFFKDKLKDSINIILDSDIKDIQEYLKGVRDELLQQPLVKISKITSIGSLDYDLDKSEMYMVNGKMRKKSIPINSRAALAYNNMVTNNPSYSHKYDIISAGDKVKLLYLKMPNPFGQNVMAYVDPGFAEDFREYVDFDLVFDKYFMAAMEIMIEPIEDGMWVVSLKTDTETLDVW